MFFFTPHHEVSKLKQEVAQLRHELAAAKKEINNLKHPPPKVVELLVGDRVRGSETCGFNKSMTGTVKFVEPRGTVWVLRDGASSPCMYASHELILC